MFGQVACCNASPGRQVLDIAYGSHARHRLDIYGADSTGAARPVLVFVHGGGFVRGDKSERAWIGHHFACEGFVCVVQNYRLAPQGVWPAGAEDVAAALGWTQRSIAQFGGDPARIFAVGESAGAAHVAAASLLRRFHGPGGLGIAGAALLSGVYNPRLEYLARKQFGLPTPDPRNDAYFGSAPEEYAKQSVVALVDAAPFPLLISYAELDPAQMQVQAGELFARLVATNGFQPELKVIPGHNHLSQIWSLGTADTGLSGVLLDFIQACAPAPESGAAPPRPWP